MWQAPDTASTVVAELTSDDLLMVQETSHVWSSVKDLSGRTGFMLRAGLQELADTTTEPTEQWVDSCFKHHQVLAEGYSNGWNTPDGNAFGVALNDHEDEYLAALRLFARYFCASGRTRLLEQLILTMWADRGSASESPSYQLSLCFRCHPEVVRDVIARFDEEVGDAAIGAIAFGLANQLDERDPIQKAELDRLMFLLER